MGDGTASAGLIGATGVGTEAAGTGVPLDREDGRADRGVARVRAVDADAGVLGAVLGFFLFFAPVREAGRLGFSPAADPDSGRPGLAGPSSSPTSRDATTPATSLTGRIVLAFARGWTGALSVVCEEGVALSRARRVDGCEEPSTNTRALDDPEVMLRAPLRLGCVRCPSSQKGRATTSLPT